MSDSISFPSPQFLAEHQQFVRRLALGLARDEAGADDLVQETWLAALVGGSGKIVNPRAWLATAMRRRAQNAARAEGVRHEHEARAARREASEDERLHERVSFQHSLVAAVLELDDPYRTVVMLRYFQGLSPAAIARRRNVPAATVRSQLARALAQLRAKLEQREGGREAWCTALAGFLENSKPVVLPSAAIATAAGVCVLVGGAGAAWVWSQRAPHASEALVAIVEPAQTAAGIDEPDFESARVAVMAQDAKLDPAAALEGPSSEELGAKTLEQLQDMLTRVEDELRPRLLTPPADVTAAWSAQHSGPSMQFARVLDRTRFKAAQFESGVVGVRGGGAYFSFVTGSNSYDEEPTIGLQGESLSGNFYGGMKAALMDLGLVDPPGFPRAATASDADDLAALSLGPALPAVNADPRLSALLGGRSREWCTVRMQHTYVLRSVSSDEHDVLAVFVPIHRDANGLTLAWRVLQTWPVPDRRTGPTVVAPRKSLAVEPWSAAMSTDGLLLLLGRLRVLTTARLMAIPDALRERAQSRPIARLLRDYWGMRYVNIDGGGRFFNFATRSNDYQQDPEIDLQGDCFGVNSGQGGGSVLLDLGLGSAQTVGPSFAVPDDERSRLLWDLAWNFKRTTPPPSGQGPMIVSAEEAHRFWDFRNGHSVRAVVGHCYLLRSILPGKHDHLVAFEILDEDTHGIFITWKILKTWE